MNLNKAIIAGRVTAKPELKQTQSGSSLVTFSLATNRNWTGKDGQKHEEVEFIGITAWGRQAEVIAQYVEKGQLLLVEGRIHREEWKAKDGSNRSSWSVILESFQFGPKSQRSESSGRPEEVETVEYDSPAMSQKAGFKTPEPEF